MATAHASAWVRAAGAKAAAKAGPPQRCPTWCPLGSKNPYMNPKDAYKNPYMNPSHICYLHLHIMRNVVGMSNDVLCQSLICLDENSLSALCCTPTEVGGCSRYPRGPKRSQGVPSGPRLHEKHLKSRSLWRADRRRNRQPCGASSRKHCRSQPRAQARSAKTWKVPR